MKSKQKQTPTEIIDNQRQAVVEKIIEDMKRDGLRWAEPYLPSLTPHNPVSGTVYQGGNRVHLDFIGFMRGYTDNRWATFNQIKDAGWHVKKGAKSALIEKWKQFAFYKENEDTGEKELAGRYPKLVGYWNVFNAEEELVAELGSLFLSADLGIQSTDLEGEFYENHVSYLQSWMSALENDPSYLFKAASKADHADTFIMERYEEELGKNIEIDAPELEEEVSLAGESHDMASASEHQPESEMPESVLSTVL